MRARSLLRILRVVLSIAILAAFLFGGRILSDSIAFGQLVPAFLRLRVLLFGGTAAALFVFPLLILVTLLIGRGYCSSLCPLGTLQDLAFSAVRRVRRARLRYQRPRNRLRVLVLALSSLLWLGGSTLLFGLLEPYTIAQRGLTSTLRLARGARPDRHQAVAPPAPLAPMESQPEGARSLREVPLPLEDVVSSVAGLLILLSVLSAAGLKGRLFCNTLCPAGTLLAAPARFSLLRIRIAANACTACRRCSRVCPARCIDVADKRVDAGSCVLCFDCLSVCPTDAIGYSLRGGKP